LSIISIYNDIRSNTERICKPLKTEDYVVQVAAFASPAKWHIAHTTWFFETFVLLPHAKNYQVFNTDFAFLFNSYYNNLGDRVLRTDRGNLTRPTVDEVYAYRKHVDEAMQHFLESNTNSEIHQLVTLGLNHEQQHQELLLTDIKYMLGQNPLFPAYDADTMLLQQEKNTETGFVKVEEGVYEIGYNGKDFCFDNELGRHKVYVHDFEISKALVTNADYIAFIESGAYADFNLWLDEGWSWLQNSQVKAPLYWHKIKGEWHHYTLKGLQKVESEEVVKHISFYEAMAFAEWKGMRLPTEFEWEIASNNFSWGQRWEWTNSAYLPYPGFKKAAGAIGEYNGKFMVNQMVLRGASVATANHHSRSTYRNFFHAQEQWQYTGIRLVK
jgi:ergothioneine biosynthesis protein EgtB